VAIKYLLFDFDGTIADTSAGIISSIKYALNKSGISTNFTENEIREVIGPPLKSMIKRLFSDKVSDETVETIAMNYRQQYSQTGLYQVKLYDGVKEMLQILSNKYNLYIVSSKPKDFIVKLLLILKIESFFKGVYGPGMELAPKQKADLIEEMTRETHCDAGECVMIGDKAEDIIAAKQNNMLAIGISYGYGTAKELKKAESNIITNTPSGIVMNIAEMEGKQ
jgi:phosphoglycolate phosphatase